MLKSVCLSANELTGTGLIIEALARFCRHLEKIWIVHYHFHETDSVNNAFIELAESCKHLKTVNFTGLYVSEFFKELELEVCSVTGRTDIHFVVNQHFDIPLPKPNLDSCMTF